MALFVSSPLVPNLFEILQFILINWFYFELVYKKKSEPVALIGIGVYIAVLLYSVVAQGLAQNYTTLWCTGAFIALVHTIFYAFNVPRMVIERYFDSNLLSNMIFNASFFIYAFIALVMFFLFDSVTQHQDAQTFYAFWSIHNAFAIIRNIGFAIAFYYTGKRHIYMTMEQLERIANEL